MYEIELYSGPRCVIRTVFSKEEVTNILREYWSERKVERVNNPGLWSRWHAFIWFTDDDGRRQELPPLKVCTGEMLCEM